MAFEKGVVVKLGPSGKKIAWIKTMKPDACKACASRKSCGTGGSIEQTVEAINTAGAKVGDIIQVYMDTTSLLKATFLLYVFPILCMVAGGGVGHALTGYLGMESSLLSVCAAFGCFALAMVLVRIRAGRMAFNIQYRPKITRILGRQKDAFTNDAPHKDCSAEIASGA